MENSGLKSSKTPGKDVTNCYSDEQLESIITQVNHVQTAKRRHLLFKYISAFCSCLRPSLSQPAKLKEERTLLPTQMEQFIGTKTLVLDLDETLVHSSLKPVLLPDIILKIDLENREHVVYVNIRPGVREFLNRVSEIFEVILFTASLSKYADPLLDKIDPDKRISTRLFRESCVVYNGSYVKDLSLLGRNLKDTIIVDNSPVAYTLQPHNAVPILSWFEDKSDKELLKLVPILETLSRINDIPNVLKELNTRQLKLTSENILKVLENDDSSQQQKIQFVEETFKPVKPFDGRFHFNSPAGKSEINFKFDMSNV